MNQGPRTRDLLFRFFLVYFTLYSLATQIVGGVLLTPWFSFPALGTTSPMREITQWLAEHVFGLRTPLVFSGNSGDTAFHWIQNAWLLALAIVVTAVWLALQRDARRERTWHTWFRLFLRFAMAAQMFYYGMAKIIPTQFPPPSLVTLVTSIGDLSLSDLLWTYVGASTPYQIFTGCAEMLSGILLLTPRTTTLGALIGLADMTQVFVLNMTYDFGLKQISFHYLLMFAFLLAPDARRLANVLVLNRPAEPSSQPDLFATARANRRALVAQIVFGIYLIGMFTSVATRSYYAPGGPGVAAVAALWHLERRGDSAWMATSSSRPQRLRSPLAPRHLRHADVSSSTHGRFVRALRGTRRHEQPRHRADQAQSAARGGRPSRSSVHLRIGSCSRDDGRLHPATQTAASGAGYVQIVEQPVPMVRPPDPFAG
jgi:uncharacterized membrane protein YphA (DoxX/SURF4 family)